EVVNLEELIDIKGWKALGNKLSQYKVSKVTLIKDEESGPDLSEENADDEATETEKDSQSLKKKEVEHQHQPESSQKHQQNDQQQREQQNEQASLFASKPEKAPQQSQPSQQKANPAQKVS